jgi:hypothetical protein
MIKYMETGVEIRGKGEGKNHRHRKKSFGLLGKKIMATLRANCFYDYNWIACQGGL